jgi:hypothetical protein
MAKVGLSKLGLSVNKNVEEISWNGQIIEVKQSLPSNEKLEVCSKIINESVDDQNFYNPGRVAIFQAIETLLAYTNINVTDKQKEDPCKLFDLFHSSGLAAQIYAAIPENELGAIQSIVEATIHNIYEYKNSVLGILENISTDYSNLNLDAQKIQEQLSEGKGIELLKDVLTKLG